MLLKISNNHLKFFLVFLPILFLFTNFSYLLSNIKITQPKNGDTIISGKPSKICWEGSYNNPVRIEFSTNNGDSWNIIAESFIGNCYDWVPAPIEFENLMIKITLFNVHSPSLIHLMKPAHIGEINSVRFSRDLRSFLSSGADSKVLLWDFDSGKMIDSLIFQKNNKVFSAVFFHNSDTILIALDSTGVIWLRKENRLINLPKFGNIVRSVAVHPIENTFALSSYSGVVKFYNFDNGVEEIFKYFSKDSTPIYNVRFSNTGHFFHLSDYNGNTDVLNYPFTANTFVGSYSSSNNKGNVVWSADISFDARFIASGGVDDSVRVWDIWKKLLINTYDKHRFHIRAVNFHPAGYVCMSGSLDKFIRQWNIFTLEDFCEPIDNRGQVISADYSYDGNYIISGGRDSAIKIWRNCYRTEFNDTIEVILRNLLRVRIPHLVSSPNKKISIPIIIENPSGIYLSEKVLANISVEIPNRLLHIRNPEFQNQNTKKTRKDTVNFEKLMFLKGSIDTINTLVLKGDRNFEEIRLLSFEFDEDINIILEKDDGSIRIEEHCVGDFNSEIHFSSSRFSLLISPNPANEGKVEVAVNLLEDGIYLMDIISNNGEFVRLFEKYFLAGSYKFVLDVSGFSSGLYHLKLSSPTEEQTGKLIILK